MIYLLVIEFLALQRFMPPTSLAEAACRLHVHTGTGLREVTNEMGYRRIM
jgi:hypothetical protein